MSICIFGESVDVVSFILFYLLDRCRLLGRFTHMGSYNMFEQKWSFVMMSDAMKEIIYTIGKLFL